MAEQDGTTPPAEDESPAPDSGPQEPPKDAFGDSPWRPGAHRRSWWQIVIGEPEDRQTRLIGAAGVLAVLLVIALLGWMNQRATLRKNLVTIGETADQAQAAVRVNVLGQQLVDGELVTAMTWSEIDAAGAEGNQRTVSVAGESIHVGVRKTALQHRKFDEPMDLYYFASLEYGESVRQSLIDEAPFYYEFRGDKEGSVRRTARKMWDWLNGEKPSPDYVSVDTQELAGHDLPLLLGEQWDLLIGPNGAVDARRLRSPRDAYERFDLSTPVNTANGLEVVLEEAARQVEFAERIDPDLVFERVRIRLFNNGTSTMTVDPNLFQLQDALQNVYRPARASGVSLAPGSGQTLRLRFLVPPTARGLRFTIPGETVAGGDGAQPLAIFLAPEETYTGGVAAVGDFLVSLDAVQRNVSAAGDSFEILALMTVANLTWDRRELEAKQLSLGGLFYDRDETVEPRSISMTEFEPMLPEQVQVVFDVGAAMERADQRMTLSAVRRKAVHQQAVFNLLPLQQTEDRAQAGRAYIQQLCGARHYQRYVELFTGGPRGVLGLLSDRKAREREASRHLDLARSYYPGSLVIARADISAETD
jgi:hypothetical protein